MYLGDIAVGATIHFMFTTRRFATGAPHTLAGTPAVRVYKDSNTTEDDSGITLTADYDSRTGLNHVVIDTSADGVFYAAGSNCMVVITAGTVDSVSVVGEVVAHFSISNRPVQGLANNVITAAAVATNAIDDDALAADAVTAIQSGLATAAALDTVDNFLDTEIAAILADTDELQQDWTNGGRLDLLIDAIKAKTDSLTFTTANRVDSQVFGMQNGTVTAAAIATDAIDADAIAADAVTEIQNGLATAAALDTVDNFLDTEIAAIKAKTDSLTFTVANQVDANIQYVNDVQVTGTGAAGDEWGP